MIAVACEYDDCPRTRLEFVGSCSVQLPISSDQTNQPTASETQVSSTSSSKLLAWQVTTYRDDIVAHRQNEEDFSELHKCAALVLVESWNRSKGRTRMTLGPRDAALPDNRKDLRDETQHGISVTRHVYPTGSTFRLGI